MDICRHMALGLAVILALAADAWAQATPTEGGRAAEPDGTVKITNPVGYVRVVGWDRDSVAFRARVGEGSGPVRIDGEARAVRIRVNVPTDAHQLNPTELEVRVPRLAAVAVRTATADITVEDAEGGLDLESVSGSIEVRGPARMVYAESAGGDVYVEAASKIVRATSVDGDVTVHGARGYLEASTVSGAVEVQGSNIWEGEVTSVSGDIHFDGDFDTGGSFYFETHSGDLELVLPAYIRADFDVTTLQGDRVENDFGPDSAGVFSAGGGGTQVRVKSFKGRVRIIKR